jgi:IS4 transposase
MLDIYTDYLISSFSYTTATGLSAALSGTISHDKITRFLAADDYDSKKLWKLVKPSIRKIEGDDGVLIVDDTIEEKAYTDENDLITYHFDHTFGRNVKGVNILSLLYENQGVTLPVGFEAIQKTETYTDKKTNKERRKSVKTKNEYFRDMATVAVKDNKIKCRWVLADVWFSSVENMKYIKFDLRKDFVMPIKTNRLVCRTKEEQRNKQFQRVDTLEIEEDVPQQIFIKELAFPVSLVKHVFKNGDGSTGTIYLLCSDTTIGAEEILKVYQRRWKIEEYHKSIKSNTNLSKSPTRTIRTQQNHFFASIYAYCKLEILRTEKKLNHFAIKAKLYLQALRASMAEFEKLKLAT